MATPLMQVGYELCKPLVEAGLIPAATTRLTIDVTPNEIVTATFTTHADQRLLDAIWPHLDRVKRKALRVVPKDGGYTVWIDDVPDLRTMEDVAERCQHCTADASPLQECPFALEIHHKSVECNCCDGCRRECARDI